MTYSATVLADSPVNFYEMETILGADSGSGNKVLTRSGPILGTGVVGNGWTFDGINDYASALNFPTASANLTLEVWVQAPSAGGWAGLGTPEFIRRDGTDIVLIRGV